MNVPSRSRGRTLQRAARSQFAKDVMLPAQAFIHAESVSGIALIAAAVGALVWANLPFGEDTYGRFWQAHVAIDLGAVQFEDTLQHWVNDGLMTIFFFVVGLEIKRELLLGELRGLSRALLPGAAALGGMVVPAVIYLGFNPSGPERDGWGIVIATDIAFALGVLALLSRFVPQQARVFLLAVAIFDDLGAIAVIAVFFTDSISVQALAVAFCVAAVFYLVRNYAVDNPLLFAIFAVVLWGAFEQSGIHATIAGVLLAALVPSRAIASQGDFSAIGSELMLQYTEAVESGRHNEADVILGRIDEAARDTEAPLERLEREIVPLSGFIVIPIFALANAGIEIGGNTFSDVLTTSLGLGVLLGLVVGKPVGIVGATLLATRLGFATLPAAIRLREVVGIGLLAGIGFTVSIFVTGLAVDGQEHVDLAKAAIFVAFLISSTIGFLFLRLTARSSG